MDLQGADLQGANLEEANLFQPGQVVKHHLLGVAAHYAVVIGPDCTLGWTHHSTLEVRPIQGISWEAVPVQALPWEQIHANIKAFEEALQGPNPPRYHLLEFNCEHWATLIKATLDKLVRSSLGLSRSLRGPW